MGAGRTSALSCLAVAVLLGACGPGPPQSLDDAIRRDAADLNLASPTEVLRRPEGDLVFVVFFGDAGVFDGVGILVLDREAPWAIHNSGVTEVDRSDPGWTSMSWSATEALVYGPVNDVRIRSLEIDYPSGPVTIEARVPAFATIVRRDEEPIPTWRFLDAAGVVICDPFAPRATPSPGS
jgi:hypothetical protein